MHRKLLRDRTEKVYKWYRTHPNVDMFQGNILFPKSRNVYRKRNGVKHVRVILKIKSINIYWKKVSPSAVGEYSTYVDSSVATWISG